MKTVLNSIIVAFSMYSKIPVPSKRMNDKGMRYAMCFFPLIGAVIGFLIMLWLSAAYILDLSEIVKSAVICVIPFLVTGGIHMDGYLDTIDALSSHKSRKEKLEILKDPHSGAFAIIYGLVYMILYFAMWTGLSLKTELILAISFILSRAMSAFAVATFIKAKKSGLVYAFASEADRRMVIASSLLYAVACVAAFVFIDWKIAIFVVFGALIAFIVYRIVAYTQFNGITGDLAGYFLSLCELLMVISAQLGEAIWNL